MLVMRKLSFRKFLKFKCLVVWFCRSVKLRIGCFSVCVSCVWVVHVDFCFVWFGLFFNMFWSLVLLMVVLFSWVLKVVIWLIVLVISLEIFVFVWTCLCDKRWYKSSIWWFVLGEFVDCRWCKLWSFCYVLVLLNVFWNVWVFWLIWFWFLL